MAVHTVTLHLPSALYARVTQCAEQTGRTIEDQVLDILAAAMWTSEDLPDELARTLTVLALLNDAALWRAARSQLDPSAGDRIEALHDKRQSEGLTDDKSATLARLMRQYERALLVWAYAAALLGRRGHDMSSVLSGG